jgi:hypothetical protein
MRVLFDSFDTQPCQLDRGPIFIALRRSANTRSPEVSVADYRLGQSRFCHNVRNSETPTASQKPRGVL